jgi:dihydrofolate reductase
MLVSIIVAVSQNNVIGRKGDLPWHLSTDLRRFKRITMGHHLIMGRRTFDSIGRPLPGRTSIVLSRQPALSLPNGVLQALDLDEALTLASDDDEVFVVGGGQIYQVALPFADRIYHTRVLADVEGDVYFSPWDSSQWRITSEERFDADEQNDHAHVFQIFQRVKPASD